jgi:DNA polymerase III subunit epsilon
MATFAVVDIETTGGNFHQDRIIEVAVVLHDGAKIIGEYTSLVNPQRAIQPFISRLTGISNKMVRKAPTFEEIAEELSDLLKGHIFVAHNVKFDYGFLKSAFKRADINFRAPHFCTVELSRVVFPGHPSYSLGKLSRSMGIEVQNRHRAYGDAAATAILLERMMQISPEVVLQAALSDELDSAHVPEQLSREAIDALPEEAGVYYFYDEEGRVLFVGKAKNIRQAVLSHFRVPLEKQKDALTAFISDLDYEVTGNDMIATMMEAEAILQHHPRFNKPMKAPAYKYGIYTERDEQGYLELRSGKLQEIEGSAFLQFTTQSKAEKAVQETLIRAQLLPTMKQVYPNERYNVLLEKYIKEISYPAENCCLVDMGRDENHKVFIWIKGYRCIGYTMHQGELPSLDPEQLNGQVQHIRETPDLRRHLMQYLRKKKNRIKIVPVNL